MAERGRRLSSVEDLRQETRMTLFEAKAHLATSWSQIKSHLPPDFNPHHHKFLWDYFRAQLRIQQGKLTKARKIFEGLDKRVGYREFEEENQALLAAIDLAVRGESRRDVEPAFRVEI